MQIHVGFDREACRLAVATQKCPFILVVVYRHVKERALRACDTCIENLAFLMRWDAVRRKRQALPEQLAGEGATVIAAAQTDEAMGRRSFSNGSGKGVEPAIIG